MDRAAEMRGDQAALQSAAQDSRARAILLWRGKPLVVVDDAARSTSLGRLPLSHPILADVMRPPILLGREQGGAVFAYDLSDWTPDGLDEAALAEFLDTTQQWHPSLPEDHVFCELRATMTRLTPRDAELAATARAVQGWHRSHRFCAVCGQESTMAQAGWQRDCSACGASHFPRTDPVVIMLITHGNSVLVGRSPGWPEGMYSLLAGFVEPGETLEAAVRREVMEEAGVNVGRVDYLSSQPWPFPSSLMFGARGEALTREITMDPQEIEDARWVPREEMIEAFAGTHPLILPARKGAIAHFILRNWLADRLD